MYFAPANTVAYETLRIKWRCCAFKTHCVKNVCIDIRTPRKSQHYQR
jgi:hypothetical protein